MARKKQQEIELYEEVPEEYKSLKVFNRWPIQGIVVNDPGLRPYITLFPRIMPKTGAKYAGKRFYKSKISIVERLINKLMVPGHKGKKHFRTSGHCTGKASHAYKVVKRAFEIIEEKLKQNPIEVLVRAIENAATREEVVTIEYGGARYPKAVECAPQRRVDIALRMFVFGAYNRSFDKPKKIAEALAEEIIEAYNSSPRSVAIAKKIELEKQAQASR